MIFLDELGKEIAKQRKAVGLTQRVLAERARIGLSTLDALENGRMSELGYSKVNNILLVLGLELKLQKMRRPTLEELLAEQEDDDGLHRSR